MRIVRWIKSLFVKVEVDEVDYEYEQLPPHVKEFMEKRLDDK
tara:strand:+ start:388 stop:513 length:126 start_codon:yes stop_codon:yes gene_type:complete